MFLSLVLLILPLALCIIQGLSIRTVWFLLSLVDEISNLGIILIAPLGSRSNRWDWFNDFVLSQSIRCIGALTASLDQVSCVLAPLPRDRSFVPLALPDPSADVPLALLFLLQKFWLM